MAKLEDLLQDKDFVTELMTKESVEDAQEAFRLRGVSLSVDELKQIREHAMKASDTELSEDDLDLVAGGVSDVVGQIATVGINLGGQVLSMGISKLGSLNW